eukprot:CAMPEP_0202968342 /NCGR_PEP_ID=MMETSP1396-20130829/13610_1 /ASSEMBLY_ACC=CAM_ASM_000872 /TAXON_ID= /ORGANISM="Pseudokeronopsis sp., Strain Brazil" /LENGTH=77 /DNA_ID=CAMNT_0049694547 /DNA_START=421 /DNA_END=654 /DNA_ORIENTATION=-
MDVEGEIERRLMAAKRNVEESHQSELEYYESMKSLESKKKKKVNFASPEILGESAALSNHSSSIKSASQRYQDQSSQ